MMEQSLAEKAVLFVPSAVKEESPAPLLRYTRGMERLVAVVQELSLARDMESIARIVRVAARELNGADGATFVLRDNDQCFYAEENAIAPLWKGQRFPMSACISGWVMLHHQTAVIRDIYQDPRIPHDAYRPTFVKSLVMVPIREQSPIGAIGNYWATERTPTPEEIQLIHALASTTAVAIENVQLYSELEQRVRLRTAQLEAVNKELESFSYSISHDLRAPLRSINGFSQAVLNYYGDSLDDRGKDYLNRVCESSKYMGCLIEEILNLSRLTRGSLNLEEGVNLSEIVRSLADDLQREEPGRQVTFEIEADVLVKGDRRLLESVLQNLIGNAWKYTSKHPTACIRFGVCPGVHPEDSQQSAVYYVQDDGAGFDMEYANKLFGAFQRLHAADEFEGTGIGLATVARIVHRHGGKIWAEGEVEKGATFYFTLAANPD